jgi:putative hydroxymethylpyrimidine transport system substrate-binding protein
MGFATIENRGPGAQAHRVRGWVARSVMVLVAMSLLGVVTSCGSGATVSGPVPTGAAASGGAAGVVKVSLIMDWVPWVLDIPIDVAQAKGYYTRAGLRVTQTVPTGPTDVVKFVSTDRSQFGLYYAPDILMAVADGAPIVSVASLMSHAPDGLAFPPGVKASSPRALLGKVVAVPLIPSTRASLQTMLQAAGMKPDDVRVVDPGFDLVAPLLAGKYAAVAVTKFGELVEADQHGQKLSYLDFRDWGTPDFAFLNVIANGGFAKANPAIVRAFVAATLAGLEYAAGHPREAVSLYVGRHPELQEGLLLAQWKAALPFMATATGAAPAGYQDEQSWSALESWLVRTRLLSRRVALGRVVSNQYLPTP